ncbi:MAG: CarD family transcriptional regulator [Holosporales bacterium]|jgi:CarD family transcriptional regulator|nr:CarD family transcriptional regulator [Holosporales bacterium]
MSLSETFKVGSWVVYPSHGVGKLDDIEKIEINGERMDFFVISFNKNKLVLKLPIKKALESGLRKVVSKEEMKSVFDILIQKGRKRRLMWSKRAQEYEMKVNSGNLLSIAEVIRELYREGGDIVQSFSERQIYQLAMERLALEVSIVEEIEESEAIRKLEVILQAA